MLNRSLSFLFILFYCFSASAEAEKINVFSSQDNIDLSTRSKRGRPLFFSVAGAVSVGTYQAGFIDYGITWAKENQILDLRGVIGTSAGSINALLSIISACGKAPESVRESANWKIWTNTSINNLFKKDEVTNSSIFSRSHSKNVENIVSQLWMQGLSDTCDVVLGVTTTRLNPFYEDFKFGLSIPRMDETFLIRIRGRGFGTPPLLTNYFDYESGGVQVGLPFTQSSIENFELLNKLIQSSSAVPVAFNPVAVPHCFYRSGEKEFRCHGDYVFKDTLFIDGGFFKNNPIHGAYRVFRNRLGSIAPSDVVFGVVDPQIKGFPVKNEISVTDIKSGFSILIESLLKNFISSARMKDVASLTQTFPDIRARLLHSANLFPVIGELMNYFFGFFDHDFRVFDYLMGVYDAKKGLTYWLEITRKREGILPDKLHPANWELITCNELFLEGKTENLESCKKGAGDSFENLRILYQVSLNRLYSNCSQLRDVVGINHPHCVRATYGHPPPAIVDRFKETNWKRGENESEFSYAIRLLGEYGYEYKDLGLTKEESKKGMKHIRNRLLLIIDSYAKVQERYKDWLILKILKFGVWVEYW